LGVGRGDRFSSFSIIINSSVFQRIGGSFDLGSGLWYGFRLISIARMGADATWMSPAQPLAATNGNAQGNPHPTPLPQGEGVRRLRRSRLVQRKALPDVVGCREDLNHEWTRRNTNKRDCGEIEFQI
jgi:hypothetical protein